MKKITLLGFSLLSVIILNGQISGNKIKTNETKANISLDDNLNQQLIQEAPKTPSGHIRCFSDEMQQLHQLANPQMESADDFEKWMEEKLKTYAQDNANNKASRIIPVVVHVLYGNTTQNISMAQIQSQITAMNKDFSATNTDISNVPSTFQSAIANCDIEFCLAQIDPNNQPTNGVNRVNVGTTSLTTNQIDGTWKPQTVWDPTKYFNIWVANIQGGILGYAQFPSSSGLTGMPTNGGSANTDGVVILYNAFGTTGAVSAPYNKGRTATHETGHWLGLRHIWGDASCGNDFCNDTPPQQTSNGNCRNHPYNLGVCNGNTTGEMFMNYMDYTPDACMFMFTANQKARMDIVLQNSPRRGSLLTSNVCGAAPLTANFTASSTTITAGQTVTFTNTSGGPNPITSNSWNFDVTSQGGVTPSTSTAATPPTITYNNAGTYTVSLLVGDGTSTDSEVKNGYITVLAAGSQVCDSTAATWDLGQHGATTGAGTWAPDCNGTAPSGYILGQNCYGDNGWADKIPYAGSGTFLTDVIYYFSTSGTGNVNLKVWGVNAGAPGNVLAQQSVQISQLGTGGTPTLWTLPTAASLNGNFFVGHDHTSLVNGDTVALMSAVTSTNTVWAKETGGWVDLATYNLVQSAAVIPVICNSTTTGEKEILGQIDKILVFPNPSNGTLNIALTEKKETTIEIYNLVGKLIYTSGNPLNTQLFTIDIENQPNGIYFVNIKNDKNIITKKVLIAK
ncbi:MAG: T9SS type A sorting domain-containing protein [Vicingaceae bacterium]|nr:T9SS type A sorting domain-containing protein [Vicingaceae bacterium]